MDENGVAMLSEQLATNHFVDVRYKLLPRADHLYTKALKELYDTITETVPNVQLRPNKDVRKVISSVPNDDY